MIDAGRGIIKERGYFTRSCTATGMNAITLYIQGTFLKPVVVAVEAAKKAGSHSGGRYSAEIDVRLVDYFVRIIYI